MKLLIAGSRDFSNYQEFCAKLSLQSYIQLTKVSEIISGGAYGVDSLAIQYAKENNIKFKIFKPDYDAYDNKKYAPLARNIQMSIYCDCAIIFWNGISKGTKHMIDQLEKRNKNFYILNIK